MGKLNIEFFKKADYVLVFFCAILGVLVLSVSLLFLLKEVFVSNHSAPDKVVLENDEEKTDEEKSTESTEDKDEKGSSIHYNCKLEDVYIFNVFSYKLQVNSVSYSSRSKLGYDREEYRRGGLANLIFVKGLKEEHKLFPSDSQYIFKYDYADKDARKGCSCNVYAVLKSDTNGDKILDEEDDISIYVSDYDGKNLMEVSSSVSYFDHIDKEQFLFSEFHDGVVKFFVFDCVKREKSLIKSVKQKATVKRIDMSWHEHVSPQGFLD